MGPAFSYDELIFRSLGDRATFREAAAGDTRTRYK